MKKQDIQAFFDVSEKVALITGATGGFGRAAVRGLAAAGAKVMATARTLSALERLVKEIREEGGQAAFSPGDPVNLEDVKRVVKNTVDTFGGIDILVTAAGINKVKPIIERAICDVLHFWKKGGGRKRDGA